MAGNEDDKDKALAEKAYAAAASSTSEQGKATSAVEPVVKAAASQVPAPVEGKPQAPVVKTETADTPKAPEAKPALPAKGIAAAPKAKVTRTPSAEAPAKPKAFAKVAAKPAAKPKPAAKSPVVPAARPAAEPAPAAPVMTAPVKRSVAAPQAAPAPRNPDVSDSKAAPKTADIKTADIKSPLFAGLFNFLLEEQKMDMSANLSGMQDAVTEAQAKAKAAFEKSTAMLGEFSDFAKGNVEAVMESGKILADGMQGFGSELVAEGRSTFETITGDIKELAAAKSPTDFFKIQSDMMRKNFDSAVAYGSKNSEAVLKLVSDAMAPISGRVNLAMEKVRQPSL